MATILVSPDARAGTTDLDGAISRANPGDVIKLLSGEYFRTTEVKISRSGQPGAPITILGTAGARLTGTPIKFNGDGSFEYDAAFRFFHVVDANWIRFEQLNFEHCWPRAIRLLGCRNIAIVRCHARGGKHFIWAESAPNERLSERILVDGCTWVQEPETSPNRLWSGAIQWCHVKHDDGPGECGEEFFRLDRTCYNGAMFGSRNLWGNVVIRNCDVSHAFNAVRMDCPAPTFTERRGSHPMKWVDIRNYRNVNVQINDNKFPFIRDNVTEPEGFALNWWIFRNELKNCYATLSFDKLLGGYWFVFANLVYTDPRQGLRNVTDGHDVGQCFKFHTGPMPLWSLFSFHNSFLTPWPFAKEGKAIYWRNYNNAVEFLPPEGGAALADYFRSKAQQFAWDNSNDFRGDASTHPDYPAGLRANGWQVDPQGLHAQQLFAKAWGRSPEEILALRAGSPARGCSIAAEVVYAHQSHEPYFFQVEAGQHLGAMQDYGRYRGPTFKPYLVDAVDARRIGIEEGEWSPGAEAGV